MLSHLCNAFDALVPTPKGFINENSSRPHRKTNHHSSLPNMSRRKYGMVIVVDAWALHCFLDPLADEPAIYGIGSQESGHHRELHDPPE